MNDRLVIPGEWEARRALWTCWPSDPDLWEDNLAGARAEVAAMVRALAAAGPDGRPGDRVKVLANGPEAEASARAALAGAAELVAARFGDVWLRDTGPVFARDGAGGACALLFGFNGWGGKYQLPGDATIGAELAAAAGVPARRFDFVLEGGAVDHDGAGAVLTTRQCLLNPNRNPGWSEADAERALQDAIGARHIIWLDDGLANDHTDGHVDNLARFVGPGRVVCQRPFGDDDPNRDALLAAEAVLRAARDADGRPLDVVTVPSPGLVTGPDGQAVPASHMNFIIGAAALVMPHFSTASADAALRGLAEACAGDRRTHGVISRALLSGGGSFHCITQQEPA